MKFNLQIFAVGEDVTVDEIEDTLGDYKNMSQDQAIELVKITQLKRIADSLEIIERNCNVNISSIDD